MRRLILAVALGTIAWTRTAEAQRKSKVTIHMLAVDAADLPTADELRQSVACRGGVVAVGSLSRRLRPQACSFVDSAWALVRMGRAQKFGVAPSDTVLFRRALLSLPLTTNTDLNFIRRSGAVLSFALPGKDFSLAAHFDHRGRFLRFARDAAFPPDVEAPAGSTKPPSV